MTHDADTTTIVDKISSPLVASLLAIHPNDVTLNQHRLSPHWSPWWAWASNDAQHTPPWLQLMHYFTRNDDDDDGTSHADIPPDLCVLVDAVRDHQLDRTPAMYESSWKGDRAYRISPKKAHEVDRMSSYIHHLVHSESPRTIWHAVDIGSGQGYLSRALQELDFHVLALDNNEHQTSGANRWMTKEVTRRLKRKYDAQSPHPSCKGSLIHRTVHVCPRTLEESIANWLGDPSESQRSDLNTHPHTPTSPEPVPLMVVALHACGSLTVDVLRTFLSDPLHLPQTSGVLRAWRPHSLVVVGCCYNLMSPSDFPLSKLLRDLNPVPKLTISAVHLAAQVPSQWLTSDDTIRDAELALRKVVYRALLQPLLQTWASQSDEIAEQAMPSERPIQPGLGETPENRKLGKLNDKAYQNWSTFLEYARHKLGIDVTSIGTHLPDWFTHEAARLKMESALFVVQTLRCILGPLIESLILLDRCDWIKDELSEMNDRGQEVEVEMVNLFDQATGSGRNVALVIKPAALPQRVSVSGGCTKPHPLPNAIERSCRD